MSRKSKFAAIITILVLTVAVITIAAAPFLFAEDGSVAQDDFGMYTFTRQMELNGKTVTFFESGESDFQYTHDKDGYILLREENSLTYATLEEEKLVSSGVSYDDPAYRIKNVEKITRYDLPAGASDEFSTTYDTNYDVIGKEPLYGYASGGSSVINLVIYIMFNGENEANVRNTLTPQSYFDGPNNSVRDYFYKMSNGTLLVNNMFAYDNNVLYIYKDPNPRSNYNVKDRSSNRLESERTLLTGAVNAAKSKFGDLSGYDLDVNDDGYIDALSFIISGSSASDWGNLLWPHAWDFNKLYERQSNSPPKINGVQVNAYTFNFMTSINVGVMCHELNHVIGAPDLYHYTNRSDYDNFSPVGSWDLMGYNDAVPQYSLAYMREQYIGGITGENIKEITHNGVFSLKPVSVASFTDVIAYKIPTAKNGEYFMIEYRNPALSSTYDTMLPGAGLIVYRIKEGVRDGNKDGVYQSASKPDEVHVFRPIIRSESLSSTRFANSKYNLTYAGLSPENPYFTGIGKTLKEASSTRYDPKTLYFTDGTNSGIVITTIAGSSQFKVEFSGADNIDNNYFDDKLTVASAEMVNGSFSGVNTVLTMGEIDVSYLYNVEVTLKSGTGSVLAVNSLNLGKFHEFYNAGARTFDCSFVVSEKGGVVGGVFKRGSFQYNTVPASMEVKITDADGDTKILYPSYTVNSKGFSWEAIKNTRYELTASIDASARITLGVASNGTVQASGSWTVNQWDVYGRSSVIQAAAGLTHTLMLDASLSVEGVGADYYGETDVSSWSNIRYIEAGYYTSYGVTIDGRVVAAGINNKGQLNVGSFRNIVKISAGAWHVAALDADGNLYGAGDNSGGQLDFYDFSGIVQAAAGNSFTAALTESGTVLVAGSLAGKAAVRAWTDVVKISAGGSFLYGLTSDGNVLAAGDNSYGQLNTSALIDIIDLAAGEYHGAFLRTDGVVEYAGEGSAQYKTNEGLSNLKYTSYIDAESVSLTLPWQSLLVGSTMTATADISPVNATYQRVVYESSDPNIATVNLYGKITGIRAGTVTITARVNGTDLTAVKTLDVSKIVPVQSMMFADQTKTIKINEFASLLLVFEPFDATVISSNITYSSSSSNVIVSQSGVVYGAALGESEVKASYTLGSLLYETKCIVRVISNIDSISVTSLPEKTEYRYGEAFDVKGGKITIVQGTQSAVESITPDMVTNYNRYLVGTQTVSIVYMDKSTTITVTVKDYIEAIGFEILPKTEYLYGEPLSVAGGTLRLYKAAGGVDVRNLTMADVINFDSRKVGVSDITVRITVEGVKFETWYQVNVKDTVKSIRSNLTKTSYNYLEEISSTETITLVMNSEKDIIVNIEEATVTGFQNHILGSHKLTISYYEDLTGFTYSAEVNVSVNLNGSFELSGSDETGVYWYLTTQDELPINVTLNTTDGRSVFVGKDPSPGIWYILENFDITVPGSSSATVRIFVSDNSVGIGYREIFVKAIVTEGISGMVSAELINVSAQYLYGEIPDIRVKILLLEGESIIYKPQIISYDPELVDIAQKYRVKYAGAWYETTIMIKDYAVGFVPVENKAIYYGETLSVAFYADMAKGEDRLLLQNEVSFSYENKLLGEQMVTVHYNGALGSFDAMKFTLTVLDRITSMTVKAPPKTVYKYGESFDPYSVYTAGMASGAVRDIVYSAKDFSITPAFIKNLLGIQTLTVRHTTSGNSFLYNVTVNNYCVALEIDPYSKSVYAYGENLDIIVTAVNADSTREEIPAGTYSTNYVKTRVGVQALSVSCYGVTAYYSVTVVDEVITLTLDAPTKKEYYYGEAAFFAGGKLTIKYRSGAERVLENSAIAGETYTFNSLTSGYQNITLTVGGKSISYQVRINTVSEESLFRLTGENFAVNYAKYTVTMTSPCTRQELMSAIQTAGYLNVSVKKRNGAAYEENETSVLSGSVIEMNNSAGLSVRTFRIYLKGDGNGDGAFDMSDIDELASQYLQGGAAAEVADFDGNGEFSLTDLIKWAREAAKPKNSPVNNCARGFISPVRIKEDGDESIL